MIYIDSYYDDPLIYAGQGTIAIEILKQNPNIDTIIIPIGGGGLITGIAVMAKHLKKDIKIVGVQPSVCLSVVKSFEDNYCYEEYETIGESICDSLVGGIGRLAFDVLKDYLDDIVLVSEYSIRKAVQHMIKKEKYMIEGGSATTIAALYEHKDKIQGKNIALIISGANIDDELMVQILNDK